MHHQLNVTSLSMLPSQKSLAKAFLILNEDESCDWKFKFGHRSTTTLLLLLGCFSCANELQSVEKPTLKPQISLWKSYVIKRFSLRAETEGAKVVKKSPFQQKMQFGFSSESPKSCQLISQFSNQLPLICTRVFWQHKNFKLWKKIPLWSRFQEYSIDLSHQRNLHPKLKIFRDFWGSVSPLRHLSSLASHINAPKFLQFLTEWKTSSSVWGWPGRTTLPAAAADSAQTSVGRLPALPGSNNNLQWILMTFRGRRNGRGLEEKNFDSSAVVLKAHSHRGNNDDAIIARSYRPFMVKATSKTSFGQKFGHPPIFQHHL